MKTESVEKILLRSYFGSLCFTTAIYLVTYGVVKVLTAKSTKGRHLKVAA